jgi:poly-beta-1,6-N-acetyl-D-glucosamine synthase
MEVYFTILSLAYLGLLIALYISWKRISLYRSSPHIPATFISVIIPVRNEEENILNLLNDLNVQTYPASLFEVIILDDNSTDGTAEIVRSFIKKASFHLSLQIPAVPENIAFKKNAIETGISLAKGSLIMTTDGDCRAGVEWLSTVENFYQQTKAKFISSPVAFFREKGIFKKMQNIEFASLVGSGAASLNMGLPNMCNGANIAYEKEAFLEVNGFKDNENIPSGDDEFLMHKIYRKYPKEVFFLKSSAAIIFTGAKGYLSEFLQQRKRWAGKWGSYTFFNIKALAVFVFLYNLSLLLSIGLALAAYYPPLLLMFQIIPKVIMEAWFISSVLRLSGRNLNPILFLCLQLLYPFYVVVIAIISRIGGYSWKGRKISR